MDKQNVNVVKEGWLQKRGEHIKTWRPRYFILRNDGSFVGYNSKPSSLNEITNPNNTFFLKDCKIITSDKPKPNVFIIRCLGSGKNTVVERVFATTTNQEREEWIHYIQSVSESLNGHFVVDITSKAGKITLHDFEFLKVLGKGTFGKVILCRERNTKRLCAMKILKKSLIIAKNEIQHTETENRVLRSIKHPFITSLIYAFQTVDRLCLVMEYVNGGELFFHLSREKRFTEDRARFYCAEISVAIGFLHENNIVYRDIKLENILLDNEGHIKLADFGLCKMNMSDDKKTGTFCGTPEYLAPEILKSNGDECGYGRGVDWWAVGVLLYEMLIGMLPFSSADVKVLFQKILRDQVDLPSFLTISAKSVLSQLLEKDPSKRLGSKMGFKDVQMHQFFQSIDWNKLIEKKIDPPFKPQVSSDTDTRYFEKEFTGENVQLTPPDENALQNETNYFDSFSFYGSKSSLNSQSSTQLLSNNGKCYSNTSLDKHDTHSLLNDPKYKDLFDNNLTNQKLNKTNLSSSLSIDDPMSSSASHTCLFYPYLIQYTDNRGQLYESQTYTPDNQFFNSNNAHQNVQYINSFNNYRYFDPAALFANNFNAFQSHIVEHKSLQNEHSQLTIDEQMET